MGFMLHMGGFFCSESGDFLHFATGIMHSLGIKLSTGSSEHIFILWINRLPAGLTLGKTMILLLPAGSYPQGYPQAPQVWEPYSSRKPISPA